MGAGEDAAAGQRSALCGWSFGKSCPDSYQEWFFWVK